MTGPATATQPDAPAPRRSLRVFDSHHPPATELISECVHCGFCLATCPTYRLWGEEADSPRGRIYLMKLGLDGEVALNEDYVAHFDRCLGCMACLTSCPSGVKYDQLIEATRAQIERRFVRPESEQWLRRIIFALFPYPRRLRALAFPLWLYQQSGLQRLIRASGVLSLLPPRLQMMERLAPKVKFRGIVGSALADASSRGDDSGGTHSSPEPLYASAGAFPRLLAWIRRVILRYSEGSCRLSTTRRPFGVPQDDIAVTRDQPEKRSKADLTNTPSSQAPARPLRVGLLLGCVQSVFFRAVNAATARVLAAEGCDVIVPREQGCCGALMTHAGEETMALAFARKTIDAFEEADVDVIAINAAGCGSAMKEYGHLLRDDREYAARAKAFAGKCRDISEILVSLNPRATRHALPMRVAYHDACHLQHAQRITSQPRQLLRGIPGLEVVEIEDAGICCGSAGIYNLLQPDAAAELGSRKAQSILKTGAAVVVSGNPGCTLQLRASLATAGHTVDVLHWIELLDASIAGGRAHR